jgi:hypothetical protein
MAFNPYTQRFAQNQLAQFNRLAAGRPATTTMDRTQMRLPNMAALPPAMRKPTVSPLLQRVAAQARQRTALMPSLGGQAPSPTPQQPPQQPQEADTGLMGALRAPLMSPRGQAISQAALAGLEAGGYTTMPTTLGQAIGKMGQAALQGYAAGTQAEAAQRKATLDEYKIMADIAEKQAKAGQAFGGTSMTSQSFNTLLNIGEKIAKGTATDPERKKYALAYGYLAKPREQKSYDSEGNETITTMPAQDLSQFPTPVNGEVPVFDSTTKPSKETIDKNKFIKSMESMALNLNKYRQALKDLTRIDMVTGTAEIPTDNMARASSIAEGLRLNLKELYDLGALVGGDFQILDNLITSPNSAKAVKMGSSALTIQLEQLEEILSQKLGEKDATLSGTFSTPIPVANKEEYAKIKYGQYVLLPNGTILYKRKR